MRADSPQLLRPEAVVALRARHVRRVCGAVRVELRSTWPGRCNAELTRRWGL